MFEFKSQCANCGQFGIFPFNKDRMRALHPVIDKMLESYTVC